MDHRYLREVDCSRQISFQKSTSTNKEHLQRHKQDSWARSGRQAKPIDVPALTANIFAEATIRANVTQQGRLEIPISSLPKSDVYGTDIMDQIAFHSFNQTL